MEDLRLKAAERTDVLPIIISKFLKLRDGVPTAKGGVLKLF